MSDRLCGFLNLLKGPGLTSHQVVARVRKFTGERRVGHAGTLDPGAVGVLPVAVGAATRLAMAPGWEPKVYLADVRFGASTTTDDAEGAVVAEGDPAALRLEQVEEALRRFVGDVLQTPPAFSAVNVAGERAYRRARRGERVIIPARRVRIDAIAVVGWTPPIVSLWVQCHGGTYIRSLARDLGEAVGCPAHLAALVRLRVGPFEITEALREDQLEHIAATDGWERVLWPADAPLAGLKALVLDDRSARDFAHGRAFAPWAAPGQGEGSEPTRFAAPEPREPERMARVYSEEGEFLGLAARREEGRWQPKLVLRARDD